MAATKRHIVSSSLPAAGYRMISVLQSALFSGVLAVSCTVMAETSKPTHAFYDLLTDDQLSGPDTDPLQADIETGEGSLLWHDYSISQDDSIDKVFLNEGLLQEDLVLLLNTAEGVEYLTDLSKVKELRYQLDKSNHLRTLDMVLNTHERLRFERDRTYNNAEFTISIMEETVSSELKRISGDIQGSFYRSARSAGLSVSTIQQFANIFQWQVDFSQDLRTGDRFELLLKENGDDRLIIAARIYLKTKTLSAIRDKEGQYFTEEGLQLGRTFERNPLGDGYQVSSGFNLARKHPVTGKVQPHKGTDWAVPVGTEVKNTADGVVSLAVRNHKAAGNYIEIRHGRRYVTRYLHLDSLKVEKGDKVVKGQVIGTSGNSGLSTGPHLHFELYVNGRPVDAMQARLPDGKTLQGNELTRFREATASIVALFNEHDSPILLAKRK